MLSLEKSSHPRQRGIALIVTLVLLSLLVIVLLSLVGLTRVESSSSENVKDAALARANALTALNIAVGQLQKHAGPDQRVSFRGDLRSNDAKEKNLTGIWDSSSGGGNQLVWLVSGGETLNLAGTLGRVEDPTAAATDARVFLVGSRSVELDEDRILVLKQEIEAANDSVPGLPGTPVIGRYAYWVGDEGAKASLSLADPTRFSTPRPAYAGTEDWNNGPTRGRLNYQMLPQPQVQNLLPSPYTDLDITDADTAGDLSRIEGNAALRFVNGFPATSTDQRIRELFHDATVRSEAVLVDPTVNDGKLKVDLSDASKGPAEVRTYLGLTTHAETDYSATFNISETVHPVMTEGGIRFSFYREGNLVRLAYFIDVELWNPYAANLRYEDGVTPEVSVEIVGLPTATITADGTPPTNLPVDLNQITEELTSTESALSAGGGGEAEWTPGEIKQFGSNGDILVEGGSTPRVSPWDDGNLADPAATTIDIAYAVINNSLEFRLKVGGTIVASYRPNAIFDAGTASASAGATSPIIGYGFQLLDTVNSWAVDHDPRNDNIDDAGFVTDENWNGDPAANISIGGSGPFDTTNTFRTANYPIVLFDLPRQEVVSVGELRHVIDATDGVPPYLTADNLHDGYFFSTVPKASVTWDVADIGERPLPNRYVRLINPISESAATTANLRDGDVSARYLLQTGAFNINSTSVRAWRAVLGARLNDWRYDPTGSSTANYNHAFFRLPQGGQILTNPNLLMAGIGDAEDSVYTAGRDLSDDEITRLAVEIVREIKAYTSTTLNRPFYTVREFINSNVVRDAILATTAAGLINDGLPADRQGTPAELTQGDVIAAIAPFITPRSDTFKVRAYGEVYNPVTQTISGQAWCEAIVQRVPDIAEDLTLNAAGVADPDFSTHPFGRKFIVISFRWLSSNDI